MMKRMVAAFLTCAMVLSANGVMASDLQAGLVLTANSLGPLPLSKRSTVSVRQLRKLFPTLVVKHSIGQGDSADFHDFKVADPSGALLFSIKSFINDSTVKRTSKTVPIQLLQIHSPSISDGYKLRVGDHVKDIVARRGESLEFFATHHDVAIGLDPIYYNITTGSDGSPEQFSLKDAIAGNWRIQSITWPVPAW